MLVLFSYHIPACKGQDYGDTVPEAPLPEQEHCNGIFVSYNFMGREKVYPLVKNISAQGWSFKAMATVLNAGSNELKSWKIYIGFWHNELLVSADGAVVVDGDGFPIRVGKGLFLPGIHSRILKLQSILPEIILK
ncbi:COBRA-like protein 10 [Forsythia ovata]|uniref:COBRA-like protein 10 n=1 Tax=Forsythia ovata TaxID=205694 RepID=A0ABD1S8K3_9LAMI